MKIDDFLAGFFPAADEPIHLRTFPPKGASGFAETFATSRADLHSNRAFQLRLLDLNQSKGIYFVVNSGGNCDSDITRFNAAFAEIDDRPIPEQHAILDAAPILPSIRIETKKSVHAYWPIVSPCDVGEWRAVQLRLIAYLKSDPKIKNPSRVMRLPGFNHVSIDEAGDYAYKRINVVRFDPARRFTVDEMLDAFPAVDPPKARQARRQPIGEIPPGAFDIRDHAPSLDGYRETRRGWAYAKCPAHLGQGCNSLFVSLTDGAYGCFAGCSTDDIRAALGCPKKRGGAYILSGGQLRPPQRPADTVILDQKPTRPEAIILDVQLKRPAKTVILEVNR